MQYKKYKYICVGLVMIICLLLGYIVGIRKNNNNEESESVIYQTDDTSSESASDLYVYMSIFLNEGISEEERNNIISYLEGIDGVGSITYISSEESKARFANDYFADYPELAEGLFDDNTLLFSESLSVRVNRNDYAKIRKDISERFANSIHYVT
ncbi:MAG: permease-like cell division protein FtsX [Lachnospira sp.]|nr:permease-like cell division protein FtsX [Lachnospira sp.]